MKLLFYISSMRGGGAERVMSIVCNELARRGHEVWLATDRNRPIAYTLDEKVNVVDIGVAGRGSLLRRLKKMRQVAKTVKPDVAISFIWLTSGKVRLALAGLGIPLIASEHTPFRLYNRSRFQKFTRLLWLRLADRVTILTQADADYLGWRLPRKVVMPNPLSCPVYERDTTPRRLNVLAVGTLSRWHIKGFDNLIEVWGEIASRYPGWTLEIAGGGSEADFEHMRTLTAAAGVADRVNLLGFAGNIDEVMRRSSVFVLTSRYEGFGMALVEAMSQGCACVSYDCPHGPRDIITHDRSGLLVADQNKEELRQALVRVVEDEALRQRLSQGGRLEAVRFHPDVIIDQWEKLFKEVAK